MDFVVAQTYLGAILHDASQALLAPDVILLMLFMGYALFCIGSIIVEAITERRHFRVTMPQFLSALNDAQLADVEQVVRTSGLLKRQKEALLTVYEYRRLPGDSLLALIRRMVSEEETRRERVVGRNDVAARVAPMLGLMGTLIPLGPGIAALGTGDVASLSQSIMIAFDTTVAGLATAVVCVVVSKVRRGWYENYMTALDSAMATMLQKIEDTRSENAQTQGEATAPDEAQPTAADAPKPAIVFASGEVDAPAVPDAEPLVEAIAHESAKAEA